MPPTRRKRGILPRETRCLSVWTMSIVAEADGRLSRVPTNDFPIVSLWRCDGLRQYDERIADRCSTIQKIGWKEKLHHQDDGCRDSYPNYNCHHFLRLYFAQNVSLTPCVKLVATNLPAPTFYSKRKKNWMTQCLSRRIRWNNSISD